MSIERYRQPTFSYSELGGAILNLGYKDPYDEPPPPAPLPDPPKDPVIPPKS